MTSIRLMGATSIIFLAAVLVGVYINQKPTKVSATTEQFPAQVAEQNRQADVASQLRAAEVGDFVEMLNGYYWLVREQMKSDKIALSSCPSDGGFFASQNRLYREAKDIKRVVKYPSPEYAKAANAYARCEQVQ